MFTFPIAIHLQLRSFNVTVAVCMFKGKMLYIK